jgi:hypothetical protein
VTFPDRFELAPEDALRRQQAAILALLAEREAPAAAIVESEPERTRPGPPGSTTRAAVEAMRQRLEADDKPSGERAIADALGVSRGAVRYALGKDRRTPG